MVLVWLLQNFIEHQSLQGSLVIFFLCPNENCQVSLQSCLFFPAVLNNVWFGEVWLTSKMHHRKSGHQLQISKHQKDGGLVSAQDTERGSGGLPRQTWAACLHEGGRSLKINAQMQLKPPLYPRAPHHPTPPLFADLRKTSGASATPEKIQKQRQDTERSLNVCVCA